MYSSFSGYLVQYLAGISQADHSGGFVDVELRPASVIGIHSSEASIELAHGSLALQWQRHGGTICAKAPQGDHTAVVDCGTDGGVVGSISYAAIGHNYQHSGLCGKFAFDGAAQPGLAMGASSQVLGAVQHACVGHQSCQLHVSTLLEQLDDHHQDTLPLPDGEVPSIWVQAQCTKPATIHTTASIPSGSTATLHIPAAIHGWTSPQVMLVGTAPDAVQLYPVPVHDAVQQAGVSAVRLAMDHAKRTEVQLTLASGKYSLVASNIQE